MNQILIKYNININKINIINNNYTSKSIHQYLLNYNTNDHITITNNINNNCILIVYQQL